MTRPAEEQTTSGFGRGAVLLAVANAVYVVAGYVTTTVTARLLDPADFGGFGVVMAWITVLTALLVKGLSTVVAREMAAGEVDAATAWRAGMSLGVRLAVGFAVVGAALSPAAAHVFGASELAEQFAIGALGSLTFGLNAALLAWPTGVHDYRSQALVQTAYGVARLGCVLGGAALAGIDGAVVGYVLAPLIASAPVAGRRPAAGPGLVEARRRMARAVAPVALVSIAVTAFFVVDVFALSSALGGGSRQVGIYVAYGTLAHVPFFLLQATSTVMVPAIAAAAGAQARAAAIRRTLTDTVVLLAGPTAGLVVAGDAAARVVFGAEFEYGHPVAAPLALATAAVTVVAGLVAVDIAVGRMRVALSTCAVAVGLLAVTGWRVGDLADRSSAASTMAWIAAAASVLAFLVLAIDTSVRHGALLEARRAAAGLAAALVAAIPPLLVTGDLPRTAIAAVAGAAWVAVILRLRLVDVSRGSAATVAPVEPSQPGLVD